METTYITQEQIQALADMVGFCEAIVGMSEDNETVQLVKDLLNKLQFAQDNKLRLSGKMRVIDVRREEVE